MPAKVNAAMSEQPPQSAVDFCVAVDSYSVSVGPGQPHTAGLITFVVVIPSSFVQDCAELWHENDKRAGLKFLNVDKGFDNEERHIRTYTAGPISARYRRATRNCIVDQEICWFNWILFKRKTRG